MNTLTDDLITYLKADATIAGIVSTRVFDQASPVVLTTPYLTVTTSVLQRLTDLTGIGGTANSRVIVTCWNGVGGDLAVLSDAVIDRLDGVFKQTIEDTRIQTLNYLNTQELQGPIDHVGPVPVEGNSIPFDCWHEE